MMMGDIMSEYAELCEKNKALEKSLAEAREENARLDGLASKWQSEAIAFEKRVMETEREAQKLIDLWKQKAEALAEALNRAFVSLNFEYDEDRKIVLKEVIEALAAYEKAGK